MKVVLFGNQKISIDCIQLLKKTSRVDLVAVVGCETSYDTELGYPSVKKYCIENKISYYDPPKLDEDFLTTFKEMKPDICFSVYYRNIFNKKYIDIPPLGFVNMHPSLLPKYRGPVPTIWALLNGDKKLGITLHYIDHGIDTGDMISSMNIYSSENMTGFQIHSKLMDTGYKLFKKELPSILLKTNKRIKQDNTKATYYGPYKDSLREIDWYTPIEKIKDRIRTFTTPYKGAIAKLGNETMIIWKAEKATIDHPLQGPGKIVIIRPDGSFIVSGVNGFLHIQSFEIEGVPLSKNIDFIHQYHKFNV